VDEVKQHASLLSDIGSSIERNKMSMMQLLWSFIAGSAGWFALEFVGRPVRRFLTFGVK
jgi:hypothetical protein